MDHPWITNGSPLDHQRHVQPDQTFIYFCQTFLSFGVLGQVVFVILTCCGREVALSDVGLAPCITQVLVLFIVPLPDYVHLQFRKGASSSTSCFSIFKEVMRNLRVVIIRRAS